MRSNQHGKVSNYVSGWWLGHPSEKYERQLGWLFPICGKKIVKKNQPGLIEWTVFGNQCFQPISILLLPHLRDGFQGTFHPDVDVSSWVCRRYYNLGFCWTMRKHLYLFVYQHYIYLCIHFFYLFIYYKYIYIYSNMDAQDVTYCVYIYIYTSIHRLCIHPTIHSPCIICSGAFPSHSALPPKDAALSLWAKVVACHDCLRQYCGRSNKNGLVMMVLSWGFKGHRCQYTFSIMWDVDLSKNEVFAQATRDNSASKLVGLSRLTTNWACHDSSVEIGGAPFFDKPMQVRKQKAPRLHKIWNSSASSLYVFWGVFDKKHTSDLSVYKGWGLSIWHAKKWWAVWG